jgi:hypothetical protein
VIGLVVGLLPTGIVRCSISVFFASSNRYFPSAHWFTRKRGELGEQFSQTDKGGMVTLRLRSTSSVSTARGCFSPSAIGRLVIGAGPWLIPLSTISFANFAAQPSYRLLNRFTFLNLDLDGHGKRLNG